MTTSARVIKKIRYIAKEKKTKIACICLCGIVVTSKVTSCSCNRNMIERERELRTELSEEYEGRISYIVNSYEAKLLAAEEKDSIEKDARDIARVLYGFKNYNISERGKLMIIDVILNRAACTTYDFGEDIHGVCAKEGQWILYGEQYLNSDYELAYKRIVGGNSIVPYDCYWVSVSNDRVTVRNAFVEAKATITYGD